ncbi:MAG TPA: TlpA family protein disulfide reductase [Anaerolineae bacterium]|nr:TlpA family protein disulfide reductase [Anaerolineae bacterium]HIP73740.1 TlpA family protein disulfide reductase [Anaerolineae bacterium]
MSDTITDTPATEEADEKKSRSISVMTVIIWAVILGVLALLGWGLINSTAPRPEAGEQAPDINLEFFEGYDWQGQPTATLSDMRGNVVVLNFWASWCRECRVEADLLEQTSRLYADDGVVFLGLAYADVEPKSLAYLEEYNITYPNAPDLGTNAAEDYEITGVPETFIIDKNGEIAHVQIGPISAATLNGIIQQLIEE